MFLRCRLVTFLMLLSICAFAQEDEEEVETRVNINSNWKYKNEAGIDIAPFQFVLGGSSAGYPSLFYRRHFKKTKPVKSLSGVNITSHHAYRFRVGSNLSFDAREIPDIKTNWLNGSGWYAYSRNLSNNSSFFIRVGKEKQLRSKRFELFYGYDFFLNYQKFIEYRLETYYSGQPNYSFNRDWTYTDENYSAGFASIGGFKYFLLPRLCFSAEATINLGYFKQDKTSLYREYNSYTLEYAEQSIPLSSSAVRISISPVYVVNIGYYF